MNITCYIKFIDACCNTFRAKGIGRIWMCNSYYRYILLSSLVVVRLHRNTMRPVNCYRCLDVASSVCMLVTTVSFANWLNRSRCRLKDRFMWAQMMCIDEMHIGATWWIRSNGRCTVAVLLMSNYFHHLLVFAIWWDWQFDSFRPHT